MNGLLLVDKPGLPFPAPRQPAGVAQPYPTSHDIVQQVRRLSGERRIGHTGTLDPMASGLLVLCLGRTTRLVEYYQGHAKRYRAEITLGYATDTYDALGAVTDTQPVPALDAHAVEEALEPMRGPLLQMPPIYSALKQGGESIHYKARRGEDVVVEPRAVTFHALELADFSAPDRFTLDIHCSAGAYIRSLAHDLGRALGTVATLSGLRRTAAGPFSVDEAHTPEALAACANDGGLEQLLLPPGARLDLPTYTADPSVLARLGFGQVVEGDALQQSAPPAGFAVDHQLPVATLSRIDSSPEVAQVRGADGALVGIVRRVDPSNSAAASGGWRADKWFA